MRDIIWKSIEIAQKHKVLLFPREDYRSTVSPLLQRYENSEAISKFFARFVILNSQIKLQAGQYFRSTCTCVYESPMPSLIVQNMKSLQLTGLGRRVSFNDLSQKRVTTCVRTVLRAFLENVKVSCSAKYVNGQWIGTLNIDNIQYQYVVSPI